MELNFFFLILAIIVGTSIVLFEFLRRVNEWYNVRKLGKTRDSLPPGDMGWPILGNMSSFLQAFKSSDPDVFVNNLVKKYGETGIYKTYLFGRPGIIVSTPETCRQVLMDDENFTSGYSKAMKRFAGRTFINVAHSEHKRIRKMLTSPMNGQESITMYLENIQDIVISTLEKWASMDKPIEFLCEMRKLDLRFMLRMFLGSSSESVSESMVDLFADLHNGFHSSGFNFPGSDFYKGVKAQEKLLKIFRKILNERRAMKASYQQKGNKGMIDLMIELEDESGNKLEDEVLLELAIVLIFAGRNTVAHVTTWVTINLHNHPQMLQKAKEEQEEIVKKRPSTQKGLSLNEIKEMEYLSKVINETLRTLNMPIMILRDAIADVNIKGYTIPKGWSVFVWNRALNMNTENFHNPTKYDLSRWDNYVPKPGAFIPFGLGSRRCIGSDMAKLEIYVFLHYFLLNYKLERLNPKSPRLEFPQPRPADNCLSNVVKLK